MPLIHHMTAEDFYWTEVEGRLDLIRGELVRLPYGSGLFGETSAAVAAFVGNHVRDRRLGRGYVVAGFILARDPDTVLTPDIAFVSSNRLPDKKDRIGFMPMAPDLAVEVVCPLAPNARMTEKVIAYLDAGTRLVWVVDPDLQTVTVYAPDRTARILMSEDTLQGGDVLPGFELKVAEIFE